MTSPNYCCSEQIATNPSHRLRRPNAPGFSPRAAQVIVPGGAPSHTLIQNSKSAPTCRSGELADHLLPASGVRSANGRRQRRSSPRGVQKG